jgi:succinylglutamate desuccinylase
VISFKKHRGLPDQVRTIALSAITSVVPEPTVFYLEGRRKEPLFVSTLLHGNEPSGFLGLQAILRRYEHRELPRSLIILIGNVEAARASCRMLPGQPDFNRIWKQHPSTLGQAAGQLLEELRSTRLFAAVDIHDNTGTNPPYACVSKLETPDLQMAALFNHIAVYFTCPDSTLSVNLAAFCPAVTIECGQAGSAEGAERAAAFIDALMHLDHFPSRPPADNDLTLFRTVARMKVRPDLAIETGTGFAAGKFVLPPELDHLNFTRLEQGTLLGFAGDEQSLSIECAPGVDWCDSRRSCLRFSDNRWTVGRAFVPSMLTMSPSAIHDDCLGYIMEPMPR